jgi:hypothetical protein
MAEPITPHPTTGDFDELVQKTILKFEGESHKEIDRVIDRVRS